MVALLLLLLVQQTPEEQGFQAGVGFFGHGGADLSHGLQTLGVDSLLLFPRVSVTGTGYSMKAVMRAAPLPSEEKPGLIHASGALRLPGSPWIGARAEYGACRPFLFGLERPWLSREGFPGDSIVCAALDGGGVLGFNGSYGVYRHGAGDTLVWAGVRSPWMGFGQVWWDGFSGSMRMNTVTGFLQLSSLSPWFSISDSSGTLRGDGEVRGLSLPGYPQVSGIPWVHYTDADSSQAGLKLQFTGRSTAHSGSIRLGMPLQSRGSFTARLRYGMRSVAGIHWDAGADAGPGGDWSAALSGEYRSTPAGFGLGAVANSDSVRVTGRASYSPVPSVSAQAALSADIFSGSADPSGTVRVAGSNGPVAALIGYSWSRGHSMLSIEIGGWLGP